MAAAVVLIRLTSSLSTRFSNCESEKARVVEMAADRGDELRLFVCGSYLYGVMFSYCGASEVL